MFHVSLALDLPAAVGLTAGRAVGLALLAAHRDGLLILAAVLAARALVRVRRGDRARVPGVRVAPRRGLAGAIGLECLGRRLRRDLLVLRVEVMADRAAEQAARQRPRHDPAGAAACERGDAAAEGCAADAAEHGLGIRARGVGQRLTAEHREREQQDDRHTPSGIRTHRASLDGCGSLGPLQYRRPWPTPLTAIPFTPAIASVGPPRPARLTW